MKLQFWKETHEGVKRENWYSRWIIAALALSLVIAVYGLSNQEPVVVKEPYGAHETYEIMHDQATGGYHRSWSLFAAILLGNIDPGNLEFVKEHIEPLVAPSIHEEVMTAMEQQAARIERDRIAYTFEPQDIIHDAEQNRTFVEGYRVRHEGDEEDRSRRTFEFHWNVHQYGPALEYMNQFEGRADVED